jgi:group I intron endonuclease
MIIYEIKNKINGKIYIGQHSSNELGSYWGSGKLIKLAIKKYGIDNFERSILERCSTKEELNKREKYWIGEKQTRTSGYNLIEGGTGGDTSEFIEYTEEWKETQRINTKRYWDNLSEEDLKNRSEKVKGLNNGMYGKDGYWKNKKIPEDIIQKQLDSRRSYEKDGNPNWKGGISKNKCSCGKDISPLNETCINCRDRMNEKNPFYGKKHSDESKKKIGESKKGKKPSNIRKIEIDDIIYKGLDEASIATEIKTTTIWYRIRSKNKKYESYKYSD